MCEDYIKSQQGVAEISEIGFGKGWKMLRDEFEKTLRELTRQGYSLVFLAHSKSKMSEFVDENGEQIEQLCPNLTNACAEAVNGLVDIIAYLGIEYDKEGNAHRYLQTRATKTVFAGSRYRTLEPKIELGYKNLVDAVAKAMEEEAKITGTNLITSDELVSQEIVESTFEEVMSEAREIWISYLETAKDEDEKERHFNTMQSIIGRIFGNQNFKLSQATPHQKDLVSLFIDEVKDLM